MKKLLYILSLIFILFSCKDDSTIFPQFEPVNNQADHISSYYNSGLGETTGTPVGSPYSFPDGIRVSGFIHGNSPAYYSVAPIIDKEKNPGIQIATNDKANYITYGYGSLVNLYFSLVNNTNTLINVVIPKGAISYEAAHVPSYQHGILVKTVNVPVMANDTADVHLQLFCLNAHHGIASSTVPYYLGVVTIHPDLITVCDILNSKSYIDPANYGTIQSIIWKITDNGGFGQTDIDILNAL